LFEDEKSWSGIRIIRTALDHGINHVDTAQGYRSSEETVGRALRDGYRDRCFLVTKASLDFSPAGITRAVEDSLRKLQVEYVDLYLIHSWNPRYPIGESMETMERIREKGKARFIGVSNFNASQMEDARQSTPFLANQVKYNIIDRQIEAADIPYCSKRGIGIIVHSPLAKGLLTGKYQSGHEFPAEDERSGFPRFQGERFAGYIAAAERLTQVAEVRGISLARLAVAWTLRRPEVSSVLVGAKSVAQLEQQLEAVEVRLSAEELERIDAATVSVAER
jgi:aryl-alcohol dehydrogenase-like predicted oxidoreductase